MSKIIRFDQSLGRFVELVVDILGPAAFETGKAVRDAYGRLAYLSLEKLTIKNTKLLQGRIKAELAHYASYPSCVFCPGDFGFESLADAPTMWREVPTASHGSFWVDLVDRRIVGQDWTTPPSDPQPDGPRRIVFASMKGGVGRTTALCVLAVHLAQVGHNVLVIDADLEAPGLGAFLLPGKHRPPFGLIDYLVENSLGGWSAEDLDGFVSSSLLTDHLAGQGIVDVVPAVGMHTLDNPTEMLSKLSRALLEDPADSGPPTSVRTQLREFVERVSKRKAYGAVLIDARAGFSEIAAGALLGLDAELFLFGVNQAQTFEDYRFLLSHLAHLSPSANSGSDWRRRVRFVHAKADPQSDDIETFKDRLYEVVADEFYEKDDGSNPGAFVYSVGDSQAPHAPLVVNFDFPYMRFDPSRNPGQLKKDTYMAGFSDFIRQAADLLDLGDVL